jgi:hypothetical protein
MASDFSFKNTFKVPGMYADVSKKISVEGE